MHCSGCWCDEGRVSCTLNQRGRMTTAAEAMVDVLVRGHASCQRLLMSCLISAILPELSLRACASRNMDGEERLEQGRHCRRSAWRQHNRTSLRVNPAPSSSSALRNPSSLNSLWFHHAEPTTPSGCSTAEPQAGRLADPLSNLDDPCTFEGARFYGDADNDIKINDGKEDLEVIPRYVCMSAVRSFLSSSSTISGLRSFLRRSSRTYTSSRCCRPLPPRAHPFTSRTDC